MLSLALFLNSFMLVTCAAVVQAESAHYWLLFLVGLFSGLSGGINNLVCNVAYANWFGRTHNGSIQGFAYALIVFGSAVGPALVSVGLDAFGTYSKILGLSSCWPLTCAL